MANTGKQRSLTIVVNKTVNGQQVPGYPTPPYEGKNSFSWGSVDYPVIDNNTLATMSISSYEKRLEDFKFFVQSLEPGLDIDSATIEGGEAYRENTIACPIN